MSDYKETVHPLAYQKTSIQDRHQSIHRRFMHEITFSFQKGMALKTFKGWEQDGLWAFLLTYHLGQACLVSVNKIRWVVTIHIYSLPVKIHHNGHSFWCWYKKQGSNPGRRPIFYWRQDPSIHGDKSGIKRTPITWQKSVLLYFCLHLTVSSEGWIRQVSNETTRSRFVLLLRVYMHTFDTFDIDADLLPLSLFGCLEIEIER